MSSIYIHKAEHGRPKTEQGRKTPAGLAEIRVRGSWCPLPFPEPPLSLTTDYCRD